MRDTAGVRSRSFTFEGHRFAVKRGVFDPSHHLSGIAFAGQLTDVVSELVPEARTALDLGTGSGVLAATLARHGLAVVASDISEAAVRCAAKNCEGLDVEVRHGDMFAPVAGERFDLVAANPPYERDSPTRRRGVAFTSPDFLERLGTQVHAIATTVVIGFPAAEATTLQATGLDLALWRTVPTRGHDLGIFVSRVREFGSAAEQSRSFQTPALDRAK